MQLQSMIRALALTATFGSICTASPMVLKPGEVGSGLEAGLQGLDLLSTRDITARADYPKGWKWHLKDDGHPLQRFMHVQLSDPTTCPRNENCTISGYNATKYKVNWRVSDTKYNLFNNFGFAVQQADILSSTITCPGKPNEKVCIIVRDAYTEYLIENNKKKEKKNKQQVTITAPNFLNAGGHSYCGSGPQCDGEAGSAWWETYRPFGVAPTGVDGPAGSGDRAQGDPVMHNKPIPYTAEMQSQDALKAISEILSERFTPAIAARAAAVKPKGYKLKDDGHPQQRFLHDTLHCGNNTADCALDGRNAPSYNINFGVSDPSFIGWDSYGFNVQQTLAIAASAACPGKAKTKTCVIMRVAHTGYVIRNKKSKHEVLLASPNSDNEGGHDYCGSGAQCGEAGDAWWESYKPWGVAGAGADGPADSGDKGKGLPVLSGVVSRSSS